MKEKDAEGSDLYLTVRVMVPERLVAAGKRLTVHDHKNMCLAKLSDDLSVWAVDDDCAPREPST